MQKDSIGVYDDLVDETLIKEALNIISRIGFRYGWRSSNQVSFSHWNVALSRTGTSSGNRKDIRKELPPVILKIWESFQPSLLPKTPILIRTYSNGYTYGNDGYIHQDSQAREDMTAILFLNRVWNANWAGETAIFDSSTGEIIRSVLPKWRRLLIFPANMYHVGRGVSRICPHLRNVLVFKARAMEVPPIDQSRVALDKVLSESGFNNIPGSESRSSDQFLKTYDNLKNWNCAHPVCFAGALYGLYLPTTSSNASFNDSMRSKALELFGTEAVRLAELFASIDVKTMVSEGIAINRYNGSSIMLGSKDMEYIMLFCSASHLNVASIKNPNV